MSSFFTCRVKKSIVSYKNQSQLPKEKDIKEFRIFVDRRYESVILPIYGTPTPFHISTIKVCILFLDTKFMVIDNINT